MTYKIEKGIPLPRTKKGPGIYPFHDMEIGDSFLTPVKGDTHEFSKVQTSINSSSRHFVKKYFPKRKFTTRKEKEGIRCWRIE